MKRLILPLLTALALCCTLFSAPVFANTITFDSFGPTYAGPVGADFTIDDATFTGWSLGYDSISPNYFAGDFAFGAPEAPMATISFAEPIYLTGFNYFTSGLTCALSRHGTPVAGGGFLSQTSPWAYFNGARAWIDEISFQLPNTPGMAMASLELDNVEYEPVPIPGVLWLLGSAFLGIAGVRKRFMN